MTTVQLFNEIMRSADLLGLAVAKRINPAGDLITKTKAIKDYGRDWIEKNTEPYGPLKTFRKGVASNSKVMYSLMEIAALIETERQHHATMINEMSNE